MIAIKEEKIFYDNFFKRTEEIRANQRMFYDDSVKKIPLELAFKQSGDIKNKTILCYGQGANTSILLSFISRGANVTSIDISDEAVKMVREAIKDKDRCKVMQMNAEKMSFRKDSFDVVFGRAILHHLDINKAAKEIHRVLKSGGKAIFIEPLGNNPLINLYRYCTQSDRTKDEHPLRHCDFVILKKYFRYMYHRNFFLLSLIAIVFKPVKKTLKALIKLDEFIFRMFPFIDKYAWCTVITLEK
jgi:ubiquinone/menaquinone biosynthesis C-methylase UbiE